MSAGGQHPMTLHGFLDWESRQELKYEFDGFGPGDRTNARSFRQEN